MCGYATAVFLLPVTFCTMASPRTLKLFCYISGDDAPFPVDITSNKIVHDLKIKIKEEDEEAFREVHAKDIVLRKINLESKNFMKIKDTEDWNKDQYEILGAASLLSDYYEDPQSAAERTVHIIVICPDDRGEPFDSVDSLLFYLALSCSELRPR